MSKASYCYGFITFIAEVAGWYNLFLGGSVFALWEVLGTKISRALAKIHLNLSQLFSRWHRIFYFLVSSGILVYIFIDCITILILNPVGITTFLTKSAGQDLCLSICLPQYTSSADHNVSGYKDITESIEFWDYGNNIRNKIFDLSMIMQGGDVITIWNINQSATFTAAQNLFSIFNIVSSDRKVTFCHTVELSILPRHMRGLRVRAVNDIELVVHLPGQLLATQSRYVVANTQTVKVPKGGNIFLHNSVVSVQLEETSFQNVSTQVCQNYNMTWTFDSCVVDFVILELGSRTSLLRKLLLPSYNTTVKQGIEVAVLHRLYAALLSRDVETVCLRDCRSLIVDMKSETSPTLAQPLQGFSRPVKVPLPLPPLMVEVNLTLPDLSKLNQVIRYYTVL
jgi:uncharacterized membrane protein